MDGLGAQRNDSTRLGRSRDQDVAALTRLRRIEGQIRGVQRMIQDGRPCLDVVVQLRAIRAATGKVAEQLLEEHIRALATDAIRGEERGEALDGLVRVVGMAMSR